MADALGATIGAAPEQWYSFKPIWPPTEEEAAELAHRADRMLAGDRSAALSPVATPQLAPDETPIPSAGSTAEPPPAPLAGTEFGPS
jgi:hypothetical protein